MNQQEREKVAQVLVDAAAGMRQLKEERDAAIKLAADSHSKMETIERRLEAEKTAAEMHRKGINLDTDFSDLADTLEKAATEGKLETIQHAVDMVGPDMGVKTAAINNDSATGEDGSQLVSYLVGQIG